MPTQVFKVKLQSWRSRLHKYNLTKYAFLICIIPTYTLIFHLILNPFESAWLNIVLAIIFVIPILLSFVGIVEDTKYKKTIRKVSLGMMLLLCSFLFFYNGSNPKVIYSGDNETVLLTSQDYTLASPFADVETISLNQLIQIETEQGILSAAINFNFTLLIDTEEQLRDLVAINNEKPKKDGVYQILKILAQASFDDQTVDLSAEKPLSDEAGVTLKSDLSEKVYKALKIKVLNLTILIRTSLKVGPYLDFKF